MSVIRTTAVIAALAAMAGCARFEPTEELVVPLDERPAVQSSVTPPPISGGTLVVLRDARVVAADPDRDRVLIVDVIDRRVVHEVALRAGDEPGRVVEGDDGVVHVVLRGADAVATIDAGSGTVVQRRATCAAPRGIAWDGALGALHVACASGSLITFEASAPVPARTIDLRVDLRDVIVAGGRLFVTRFKTAVLLEVDPTAATVSRIVAAPPSERRVLVPGEGEGIVPMSPAMAWRAAAFSDGSVVMVHQRGQDDEVVIAEPTPERPSSYGGGGSATLSLAGCAGIVESAVTMFEPSGAVVTSGGIAASVLPVDVAVGPVGRIAVANAGARDPDSPQPFVRRHQRDGVHERVVTELPPQNSVEILGANDLGPGAPACQGSGLSVSLPEPVTAVAFSGSGERLYAQTREPARLYLVEAGSGSVLGAIELGGDTRLDTGHELFHRDTGSGIACASCHGEGGEDGRVWRFHGLGPRRTQPLDVGLAGTAPFHWDGEMRDLGHLMSEVLVGRMGGAHQSDARLATLEAFLFGLEPKTPIRDAADPAVARGRAVFESAGCESCHVGASFTNSVSVDVGTGGELQVPSLVGVGYRAPFRHDGCAATLRARFDPECGGGVHGTTGLSEDAVGDLLAYLESL